MTPRIRDILPPDEYVGREMPHALNIYRGAYTRLTFAEYRSTVANQAFLFSSRQVHLPSNEGEGKKKEEIEKREKKGKRVSFRGNPETLVFLLEKRRRGW